MPRKTNKGEQDLFSAIESAAARALMVSGVECFAETGFHGTTTRDISKRAGLSPAAVYVHFPSKADLLYSISRLGHEAALEALEQAPGDESDPARRVSLMVGAFASWHARNHRLARVVQYELSALPKSRRRSIAAIRQQIEGLIEAEIEGGRKAGRFSADGPSGPSLAILSLCIDVARWYTGSGQRSPRQLGNLYSDLVLRMLGVVDR